MPALAAKTAATKAMQLRPQKATKAMKYMKKEPTGMLPR